MNIYTFEDYKSYLLEQVKRIKRITFTDAIGCNASFLSQVLNGKPHLSLEQGIKANKVLGHNADESEFFMDLLQMGRAGTQELRQFFFNRLQQHRKVAKQINKQIVTEELQGEFKTRYYSRFTYSALHVLSSLSEDDQEKFFEKRLNLTPLEITQALGFLNKAGLIKQTASGWKPTKKRVHLAANAAEIVHHHRNFRLEAMQRIEKRNEQDIFYSGVFTVSHSDLERIRELVLKLIREKEKILLPSRDEVPFIMNLDFFEIM